MRRAESRNVNVIELKGLKCLVGVSRMERVGNAEVCRRAEIERELTSRVDQRVLRWFLHGERVNGHCLARWVLWRK